MGDLTQTVSGGLNCETQKMSGGLNCETQKISGGLNWVTKKIQDEWNGETQKFLDRWNWVMQQTWVGDCINWIKDGIDYFMQNTCLGQKLSTISKYVSPILAVAGNVMTYCLMLLCIIVTKTGKILSGCFNAFTSVLLNIPVFNYITNKILNCYNQFKDNVLNSTLDGHVVDIFSSIKRKYQDIKNIIKNLTPYKFLYDQKFHNNYLLQNPGFNYYYDKYLSFKDYSKDKFELVKQHFPSVTYSAWQKLKILYKYFPQEKIVSGYLNFKRLLYIQKTFEFYQKYNPYISTVCNKISNGISSLDNFLSNRSEKYKNVKENGKRIYDIFSCRIWQQRDKFLNYYNSRIPSRILNLSQINKPSPLSLNSINQNLDELKINQIRQVPINFNTSSKIVEKLEEQLAQHDVIFGKLNITLEWYDPNDLDLCVICPCNTKIYFNQKKCEICGGCLDLDMNLSSINQMNPFQHVYFNAPKPGKYKAYVKYYSKNNYSSGCEGPQISKFKIYFHNQSQILKASQGILKARLESSILEFIYNQI